MRCDECKQLIRGKSIVDHVVEINPDNYQDDNITLGEDNLQLLCIECHNSKTFRSRINFEMTNRSINLF
ncbi:TPA: HNH endonuclease [Streptococcus suis]